MFTQFAVSKIDRQQHYSGEFLALGECHKEETGHPGVDEKDRYMPNGLMVTI